MAVRRAFLAAIEVPLVQAVNLALLVAYPFSWAAPLANAGVLPFFSGDEITIVGGVLDLWESDPLLAILVGVFAVVVPYGKTLALAVIHMGRMSDRALPVIELIGKLSMADVFLIALYIIIIKGVGIGHVTTAWGLWLFTMCVLVSIWVAWATARHLGRA